MELIVAEKPKVAEKIAAAIGSDVKQRKVGQVSYYEGTHNGTEFVVAPAVGHLYTLVEKKKTNSYPVFDIEWVPSHEESKAADFTKKYLDVLEKLGKKADVFVSACDYDIEGCLPDFERIVVVQDGISKITDIGTYVDPLLSNTVPSVHNGFEFIELPFDAYVPAVNSDLKTSYSKINKIMRRKGDGTLLRITLDHGKAIHVTKNHPVFVFAKDGFIQKKAGDLAVNDFLPCIKDLPTIPTISEIDIIEEIKKRGLERNFYVYGFTKFNNKMPAEFSKLCGVKRKTALGWRFFDRIPLEFYLRNEGDIETRDHLLVGAKKSKTKLPARIKLDRDFGKLVGYYLAEGCIDTSGFVGFYFGPTEDDLVDDVEKILAQKFNLRKIKRRKRKVKGRFGSAITPEIGTKSKTLSFLFENVLELGRNSHKKKLPPFILSTPVPFIAGLTDGYLLGDGSAYIETRNNRCVLSAGSVSRQLIHDLHMLLLRLGVSSSLIHDGKRKINYLTIGVAQEISKLLNLGGASVVLRKKLGFRLNQIVEKDRVRKDILASLPNMLIDDAMVNSQTKRNMKCGVVQARTSISSVIDKSEFIKKLISGGVHPFKVIKIEELPYDGYVYDFQTDTTNFMHGNGVITHNSTIAYNIFRFATPIKEGKRMKFSALTSGDLLDAYENMGEFDYSNAYAGEARHILDWYYGINLSRALMSALKAANRYRVMSVGRVQGPALSILSELELRIRAFVPSPYWELSAMIKGAEFLHEKGRFPNEEEAKASLDRTTSTGTVASMEKKEQIVKPNPNFDLTSLQVEAHALFSIPPSETLELAQRLYEDSLISYPRTSSQQIPASIKVKDIVKQLAGNPEYKEFADKLIKENAFTPIQGKKTDPAHPAIHPLGQRGRSEGNEKRLYDLIVRRFLSSLSSPAKKERTAIIVDAGGEQYNADGVVTKEPGWISVYGPYYKTEDRELPEFRKDERVSLEQKQKTKKETKPPKRYTQASIISELERRHLGTKATRSTIIDTLFKRGYVDGKPIEVTDFGMKVCDVLKKHAPEILDEALTQRIEDDMEKIQDGSIKKEEVIKEGKEILIQTLDRWKKDERAIGDELYDALKVTLEKENMIGVCDKCGKQLRIIRMKTGSQFIGCTGYPDCRNTYPLPQAALIKPAGKPCPVCGKPVIYVIRKGKRRFEMCIDPQCPSKKDWGKKKE